MKLCPFCGGGGWALGFTDTDSPMAYPCPGLSETERCAQGQVKGQGNPSLAGPWPELRDDYRHRILHFREAVGEWWAPNPMEMRYRTERGDPKPPAPVPEGAGWDYVTRNLQGKEPIPAVAGWSTVGESVDRILGKPESSSRKRLEEALLSLAGKSGWPEFRWGGVEYAGRSCWEGFVAGATEQKIVRAMEWLEEITEEERAA